MILQNFIVLEGIDGSGTSTQIALLKNNPDARRFLFTAEPTGAATGQFLRRMLRGDVRVTSGTAAHLFAADRHEHIYGPLLVQGDRELVTGVREACEQGIPVVCDRYLFSSLAYQGSGCPAELPRRINGGFPLPRLLLYFEIPPARALERIRGRDIREIYEEEEFLSRAAGEYRRVLAEYDGTELGRGMRIVRLDATRPAEQTADDVWRAIAGLGTETKEPPRKDPAPSWRS